MIIPTLGVYKVLRSTLEYVREDEQNASITDNEKFIARMVDADGDAVFYNHDQKTQLKAMITATEKDPHFLNCEIGWTAGKTRRNALYVFSDNVSTASDYIGNGVDGTGATIDNGTKFVPYNHENVASSVSIMVKSHNHLMLEILAQFIYNTMVSLRDVLTFNCLDNLKLSMGPTQIKGEEEDQELFKTITMDFNYQLKSSPPASVDLVTAITAETSLCIKTPTS